MGGGVGSAVRESLSVCPSVCERVQQQQQEEERVGVGGWGGSSCPLPVLLSQSGPESHHPLPQGSSGGHTVAREGGGALERGGSSSSAWTVAPTLTRPRSSRM